MSIHKAVQAMADADANKQGISTLGELRAALRVVPAETPVRIDNGTVPSALGSYRGYYERLAIGTKRYRDDYETQVQHYASSDIYDTGARCVDIAEPVTAAEFLKALDLADGEVFEGYKGGQYEMHASTFLHVAEHGDVGSNVVGAAVVDGVFVIQTEDDE